MFDFPTLPATGTVVTVPDGSYRVWDSQKWRAAPSGSSIYPPGTGFLPLAGGTVVGPTTFTSTAPVTVSSLRPSTSGGSIAVQSAVSASGIALFSDVANDTNGNYLNLRNAVAGSGPTLRALGPDASINLNLQASGPAGIVNVVGNGLTVNQNLAGLLPIGNNIIGSAFSTGTDSLVSPTHLVNWVGVFGNVGALAWTPGTTYALNNQRNNGGNIYIVTTAGTSASSGGPTGTGTGIADGSVVWNYLASDYVGIRSALSTAMFVRSPPGPSSTPSQRQWPATATTFQATANVGGTANTSGAALGLGYAGGDQSWLFSGATFWQAVVGREFDVGIFTGASAKSRYGINLVSYGNLHGVQEDNAIIFGSSGAGGGSAIPWADLMHIGEGGISAGTNSLFSYYPRPQGALSPTGGVYINPTTVQGFDLSNILITGTAFRSPGNGGIAGNGALFSGAALLATSSTAVSLDTVGSIVTAVPTIDLTSPVPGDFHAGDQLYDASGYGCIITINTVDGTGRPLTWTLTQAGGTLGAAPSNPVVFSGGSGENSRFNLTWTRVNTLSLQPSGGATVFGGPVTLPAAGTGLGASGPTITAGSAAPASTQPKGSLYCRTGGGVATTLYVSQGGGTWNAVAGV